MLGAGGGEENVADPMWVFASGPGPRAPPPKALLIVHI
jgi:hypothetical protein